MHWPLSNAIMFDLCIEYTKVLLRLAEQQETVGQKCVQMYWRNDMQGVIA